MQQSIQCSFMTGALTDLPSVEVTIVIIVTIVTIVIILIIVIIVIIMIIVIFNMIINMRCIFTQGLMRSFEQQNASVHEILYYHKNSTGIWLEVDHPYHGVDVDSDHCMVLNGHGHGHGHGKKGCVIIFRLN